MATLTAATLADAGLLRAYIAARHGAVLTFGGSAESMARAVRLAKRLAKLSGRSLEAVVAGIQADYLAAEAA